MKNSNGHQAETLKKSIDNASHRMKEGMRSVIDSSTRQMESAFESNLRIVDSMNKAFNEKEVNDSLASSMKSNFGKNMRITDKIFDTLTDFHSRSIDHSIDFAQKFAELMSGGKFNSEESAEKLISLVKNNLGRSSELLVEEMEKIAALYNEHLNLTLNHNKVMADILSAQLSAILKVQYKNMDGRFNNNFLYDWWKDSLNTDMESVKITKP